MPMKPTPAPRRRPSAARKEPLEIVVRRGASRRFDALKKKTTELPVVVSWDRRKTDRRASSTPSMQVPRNRRATDRRKDPPFTWELADFVVVDPPLYAAATPKGKAKKR
jgi:hypothetical protein